MIEQANLRPIATTLSGWADAGHGSLAQRLAFGLRRQIEAGVLPAGMILPPERRLAAELVVSRSTVTAAMDILRADELVASRQGRGTVVLGSPGVDLATNRMADHLVAGAGGIDLAVGNPADVSHLPSVSVDVADLLASGAGAGFHPLGLPALRAALAEAHCAEGLDTTPDEVHVTAGGHQAVALAIGILAGRRDAVAVASPSYPGVFDILGGIGCPMLSLQADRAGTTPESLRRALDAGAQVVYVQSGPDNPTGTVAKPGRLRALATLLDRYDATVVEDGSLAELAFDGGRPPVDLARLCRRATVVTVGSFSKVLWGGLRVGWLRASAPIVDRTLHRRLAIDLGPAVPSQLLTMALLPHLAEIGAQRRAFLADHVTRGAALLAAELPDWEVPVPAGGSVLWAATPLADTGPLVQFAHRHGVHVAAGSIAVEGQRPDRHVRVCVDRPWELVEAGLARLAAAWRELSRRPRRVAG